MFTRISNAFKHASTDKNYLIITVVLFFTLLSSYLIDHPIIWILALAEMIVMFGLLITFYFKK